MTIRSAFAMLMLGGTSAVLAGCGAGMVNTTAAPHVLNFAGSVHGGQQPVAGATLQLYVAGTTGYGSAGSYASGTSLLGTNVVKTDAAGNFVLTGTYTCPAAPAYVYLVATGGNPGLATDNPNLALSVALGRCDLLTPSTFILMNEVTTVASVWALAPFMAGIDHIGSSATNTQGLANAFAAVNKLTDTTTGRASGPLLPAGATLPAEKIHTLANILAACVNSTGGVAGDGSACGTLFADATVNGVAPTNTVTAALNIALHPATNAADLLNLSSAIAPFQPSLAKAPADWTLAIKYKGAGLAKPKALALDATGNVWVVNGTGNSVSKLDNSGAAISGSAGYTAASISAPTAIAVDQSGRAWVASSGNNTVSVLSTAGVVTSSYAASQFSLPSGIAIDRFGNGWVSNAGDNSVTQISSTGVLTKYTGAGITAPVGIAIDPK